MHAMQLHELSCVLECFYLRLDVKDREAADVFLGLGERSIGDAHLAAAQPNEVPFRAGLESRCVLENAAAELVPE